MYFEAVEIVDCFQETPLQASAACALFGRLWDLENFDAVLGSLGAAAARGAYARLGYFNAVNPLRVAWHRFELRLARADERRMVKVLLDLGGAEAGNSLTEGAGTQLSVVTLQGMRGHIADDRSRTELAALSYAHVGERGNVPAWRERAALLPQFLVGARPFPAERVLRIVRQYEELEAAGVLRGLRTAIDIGAEHTRLEAARAAAAAAAAASGRDAAAAAV
ncbi:hypothetical protein JKP88DRAFT_251490 [Tribonema minus]|uniref:Uncharacterized protein n=1 Tax=Tribonema minus TaxID=303371 RepID=A0A836CM05_9STRA|nr:hypothetical protein JKP88DRAFT_255528 [Tribonema minus]KAG5191500.1 hypothetical protein JKP88DRAFT_251490 [Tribonema minus]